MFKGREEMLRLTLRGLVMKCSSLVGSLSSELKKMLKRARFILKLIIGSSTGQEEKSHRSTKRSYNPILSKEAHSSSLLFKLRA